MNSGENIKVNLDDLSKDDLVKKCKCLISFAQKAKISKESLHEENNKLKKQLLQKMDHGDSAYEILDKLTEEKLFFDSQIECLKERNNTLEEKLKYYKTESRCAQERLSKLETENMSYSRQVKKLADENKQLHTDLSVLEIQITELNSLGLQQQEQLLLLEQTNGNSLQHLQSKLFDSFEEVKKLNDGLKVKEGEIKELTQELLALKIIKSSAVYQSNKNYDIYVSEINDLKVRNETYRKDILKIENVNDELKDKVKLYHSKLKKFALTIKKMKEGKNQVLEICKVYTEQIKEWKEQLVSASEQLVKVVNNLECENKLLKQSTADFVNFNSPHQLTDKLRTHEHGIKRLKTEQVEEKKEFCKSIKENKDKDDSEINGLTSGLTKNLLYHKEELNRLEKQLLKREGLEEAVSIKEKFEIENKCLLNTVNSHKHEIQSNNEVFRLAQSNKELEETNYKLQLELKGGKNKSYISNFAQTENGTDLKRENAELLLEINQINQALKERGEIIFKLKSHCEEIDKRLQLYETQANKNVDFISEKEEKTITLTEELDCLRNKNLNRTNHHVSFMDDEVMTSLNAEMEALKGNPNIIDNYPESEGMSTSTIFKCEEINQLKDFEGPWEERYGALRTLASKLKAKIREQVITITEQQTEKEELQKKLSDTHEIVQGLQSQIDHLQDEIENINSKNKKYLNKLNSVAESISRDKQLLVQNEETVSQLKKEIQKLNEEKHSVENWKKQVGAKVQTLRKELEVKNVLLKESETTILLLRVDLESKDIQFKNEEECHKQTKSFLDQTSNEIKKNSVLNLEMQDYERSVRELSQKVEKQKTDMNSLQAQFDSQKCSIDILRRQNKLLEERFQEEEKSMNSASLEISTFKKRIVCLEEVLQEKEDKIIDMTKLLEMTRSENEELSTELSKVISENQKSLNILKSERDELRNQTISIQQNLRDTQVILRLKKDELIVIRDDYETYKVRAQSVLKKSQIRDLGLEEKLLEELAVLKLQNNVLTNGIKDFREKLESKQFIAEETAIEKDRLRKRCQELEIEVKELKGYSDEQLTHKYQKVIAEHAETVRNLKVHAETLSQCYRQQLSEQEVRYNREVIELQSRIDQAPTPVETAPVNPSMPREEGEGSESVESNPLSNSVHPVPLERLLDSKSNDEAPHLKKQLFDQESKVVYLTALLSDTEQDLAKHVQMTRLLKEEIRRQQRSVEREKHAENLEYLKNIVFKMCECPTVIENRDMYINWLSCKLRELAEDILHFANYGKSDVGFSESQYRKYMKDAVNFTAGAHTCEKYLYGTIDLDEFCAGMINEELGGYLFEVPHLPDELATKYGLAPADDTTILDDLGNKAVTNEVDSKALATVSDDEMECVQEDEENL